MHELRIQVSPETLSWLIAQAREGGFDTPARYLEARVEQEKSEGDALQARFTPTVLAHLDHIRETADQEGWINIDDARERLEASIEEWQSKRA